MTRWIELGELAEVRRGTTPAKTVGLDDGPGFFGLAEISQGGIVTRQPEPGLPLEDAVEVQPDDIIIALMGKLGDSAVALDSAFLGRECAAIRLRANEDRISPRWLSLALRSRTSRDRLQRHARGSTMPRLPIRRIMELPIPVPSIPQQRRTLERFDIIDAAVRAQSNLLVALNELYDAEVELAIADDQPASVEHTR